MHNFTSGIALPLPMLADGNWLHSSHQPTGLLYCHLAFTDQLSTLKRVERTTTVHTCPLWHSPRGISLSTTMNFSSEKPALPGGILGLLGRSSVHPPLIPSHGRPGFDPWVGKIRWRRKWQSIPVLLPGESLDRGTWLAIVHRVAKSLT